MNSEYRHKSLLYIIIGIIIVVILGIYIYSVLSNRPAPVQVTEQQPSPAGLVVLTPEESAQKAAIIQSVMTQTAVPLSQAQASAKAALIKKAQAGQ